MKPDSSSVFFSILKEDDGEPLFVSKPDEFGHPSVENRQRSILGQFWLVEDRILSMPDACHNERSTLQWLSSDPKDIRRIGSVWKPSHVNTTAYEVFIELPYVEGFLLMRNWQGQVVSYDLRASNK